MKCKNCQSEMVKVGKKDYVDVFWCSECGALTQIDDFDCYINMMPKSVENMKKLVQRVLKAESKSYNGIGNTVRVEMDKIDWVEDDRR